MCLFVCFVTGGGTSETCQSNTDHEKNEANISLTQIGSDLSEWWRRGGGGPLSHPHEPFLFFCEVFVFFFSVSEQIIRGNTHTHTHTHTHRVCCMSTISKGKDFNNVRSLLDHLKPFVHPFAAATRTKQKLTKACQS